MDELISDIFCQIKQFGSITPKQLMQAVHRQAKRSGESSKVFAKNNILAYYLALKEREPERLQALGAAPEFERAFLSAVQVKPRRTASGVATITVITKPWPCSSACLYCPNDIRMPKSYLSDEPACQRAEHNYFDPYLQVYSRLCALTNMGHPTDKIELIVLGGTWSDYPQEYQQWFVTELFRALNDGVQAGESVAYKRRQFYEELGVSNDRDVIAKRLSGLQHEVTAGTSTYNEAITELARRFSFVARVAAFQSATLEELFAQHTANETCAHRVVGLVIETRPDLINEQSLTCMRELGCTKIQIGIQSLDEQVLQRNKREVTRTQIESAFFLLRRFGFKIHVHYMFNLFGTTAQEELAEYQQLVQDEHFLPDEVKLYPCVVVGGTELAAHEADGSWRAYEEPELLDLLVQAVVATPAYTRISRMIRDISAHDIIAGTKRANLRQLVEQACLEGKLPIREIRHREVSVNEIDVNVLSLDVVAYHAVGSEEQFLQWVTPEGNIAGFLRLSLPEGEKNLPAMIREVHIYGKVAHLEKIGDGPQHLGLGRALVEEACVRAAERGFDAIRVISSVGTRAYYRKLGFVDDGLYQRKTL